MSNDQQVVSLLDFELDQSEKIEQFYINHEYFQSMKYNFKEDAKNVIRSLDYDIYQVVDFFRDINDRYRKRIKKRTGLSYRTSYSTKQVVRELFHNNQNLFQNIVKRTRGEVFRILDFCDGSVLQTAINCSLRTSFLEFGNESVKDDRDFVMKCVRLDGLNLIHASERLQSDYKIALAAVKQNGKAIEYVDSTILTIELVKTALRQNPKSFVFVRNFVYNNMKDDEEIRILIQRYLSAQHVCRTRSWSRGFMFECIFSIRMDFRRKYSISYEETNKQEIKFWGELVSNINVLLSKIERYENINNPKPVSAPTAEIEYEDLGDLFP